VEFQHELQNIFIITDLLLTESLEKYKFDLSYYFIAVVVVFVVVVVVVLFLRFTSEEKSKRPQNSYIPFGLGPRNCIGMRLSLLEIKLALIKLMRKVSFVTCQETEVSKLFANELLDLFTFVVLVVVVVLIILQVPLDITVGITMVPKNGVFLKVEHIS